MLLEASRQTEVGTMLIFSLQQVPRSTGHDKEKDTPISGVFFVEYRLREMSCSRPS